jgi:hypothetical protein
MTTQKIWIKPTIETTPINLAAYYHVSRTDQGGAEHIS